MRNKREEIKRQLLLKDLTVSDWCDKYGLNYKNVLTVIKRYAHEDIKNPRGKNSLKILSLIKRDTGVILCDYLK